MIATLYSHAEGLLDETAHRFVAAHVNKHGA
jgi:hypothetical protein